MCITIYLVTNNVLTNKIYLIKIGHAKKKNKKQSMWYNKPLLKIDEKNKKFSNAIYQNRK